MKIAVVLPRFPFPLEKGDKLRAYYHLRALSEIAEIHLFAISHTQVTEADLQALNNYCKSITILKMGPISTIWNLLVAIVLGRPLQVGYFFSKRLKRRLHLALDQVGGDLIYSQLARTILYTHDRKEPKVLDLMDAFSYGMAVRSMHSGRLLRWVYSRENKSLIKFEKRYATKYNALCIISAQDKLRVPHLQKQTIHVVPNGVELSAFTNRAIDSEHDIVFVGNMGYQPNIDAAEYLVNKVLPAYNTKFSRSLTLNIVGARPSKQILDLASQSVKISGYVDDINAAYCSGRVFVAPIFHGIGQQNKVMEAILCEIPCIVSSEVAAPFNFKHQSELLIADSVNDYINYIHHVIEGQIDVPLMVSQAKQKICQKFNWETQTQQLIKVIQNLE